MDESTLNNIAEFICGNGESHPKYRSGTHLTGFFKRAGLSYFIHDGSTRQKWVLDCLMECNDEQLESVLLRLASPKEYGGKKDCVLNAVSQLNEILFFEEKKIKYDGVLPKIIEIKVDFKSDSDEETPDLKHDQINKLIQNISDSLVSESANNLHKICENYGLEEGTVEEAFRSKASYVNSRITHLSTDKLWSLAKRLEGKYRDGGLDSLIESLEDVDALSLETSFNDNKAKILNEISKARFTIWVAVAWFTNREFAEALWKKQKEGVNIQIIVIDDHINCAEWLSGKHLTTYKVPPTGKFSDRMHNKFCVIDLDTVIHGSYNWTKKAAYNNETIQLIKNRSKAKEFAEEFIRMKTEFINKKNKSSDHL